MIEKYHLYALRYCHESMEILADEKYTMILPNGCLCYSENQPPKSAEMTESEIAGLPEYVKAWLEDKKKIILLRECADKCIEDNADQFVKFVNAFETELKKEVAAAVESGKVENGNNAQND